MKLIHGECLEKMKGIDSGSIDAIICDPPYGITACKWDSIIPLEPMWEQLIRVIKSNGAIVLTAFQPFTSKLVMSNLKMFKYCWVWEKSKPVGYLLVKKQPLRSHEDVIVFYKKQALYHPQGVVSIKHKLIKRTNPGGVYSGKAAGKPSIQKFTNYPRSVLRFGIDESLHPTQKPVALMEYLIKTYTNEGETVLDFAMGSGTTGVACLKTSRNFIGIELDKTYFEIANKRLSQNTLIETTLEWQK